MKKMLEDFRERCMDGHIPLELGYIPLELQLHEIQRVHTNEEDARGLSREMYRLLGIHGIWNSIHEEGI